MKNSIYLVGQISIDKPETYDWRENVRDFFAGNEDYEILDPTNNDFNTAKLKETGTDPHRMEIYKTEGVELLVPKDRSIVDYSTMCFANMTLYDEHKPMIGSMFEMAWYYDNPEKTVIGIYDGDWKTDVYCNHPFVRSTVDVWVRTERQACELTEYYFNI